MIHHRLIGILTAFAFSILLEGGQAFAQTDVRVWQTDAPGWIVGEATKYSAKELYGYIDGGAELYLEYGFDSVTVRMLKRGADELVVELWRMKDADGAFGIFSVSGMDCMFIDSLRVRHCATLNRLMLQHGAYYITITGDLARDDIARAANTIAQRLGESLGADTFAPPPFFLNNAWFREEPRPLRLYKGTIALQNNDPDLAEYLASITSWMLYRMDVFWRSAPVRLVYVRLDRAEDMRPLSAAFGFPAGPAGTGVWTGIDDRSSRAMLAFSSRECLFVLADAPLDDFPALLKQLFPPSR